MDSLPAGWFRRSSDAAVREMRRWPRWMWRGLRPDLIPLPEDPPSQPAPPPPPDTRPAPSALPPAPDRQ